MHIRTVGYKEAKNSLRSIDNTINALLEFRKGKHLDGLTISDMKNDE